MNWIKKSLDEINLKLKSVNAGLPDELDEEGWKRIWKQGIRIQASYTERESWHDIDSPPNSKGITFTHGHGVVKWRLKNELDKTLIR